MSLTRPVKLIATYHPAAALHRTSLLRHVYEDFEAVGRAIRGGVSARPDDDWAGREQYYVDTSLEGGFLALDTETTSTGDLWSVQVATHPGFAVFIQAKDWTPPDTTIIAHNALFDFGVLDWWPARFVDTMYGAYLLGLPQGLKELAWRLCGMEMKSYHDMVGPTQEAMSRTYLEQVADHTWPRPGPRRPDIGTRSRRALQKGDLLRWWQADVEPDPDLVGPVEAELGPMPRADLSDLPFEDALYYSCRDADATLRVWQAMHPMLETRNLMGPMEMGCKIMPMIHAMMTTGMPADSAYFQALSEQYGVEMEEANRDCLAASGIDLNPNSDKQVAELLFDRLRLTSGRKTPTGRQAVDETQLRKLDHPVIPPILRYRHLLKLRSTYSEPLSGMGARIHGQIKSTRTETGRLSMAEPNLQNIPVRTEPGRRIRDGFRAPPDHLFLSADYSQIEMRVLAHETGAPTLLQIFREGRDVHTETAAAMFDISLEEAKAIRYRTPAKTLGFGVAYGLTKHGMLDQMQNEGLDWSLSDCERFLADYYKLHKKVRQWQEHITCEGIERGYVTDMFGRRRFTPELQCTIGHIYEAGVRQAINHPIQAGAAGILMIAMANLWHWMRGDSTLRPLLQIHDELLFELEDTTHACAYGTAVQHLMERAVHLDVPVVINLKFGQTWGALE